MRPLSLDRIVEGDAALEGLNATELAALLAKLGAAQARLAARLADLAQEGRHQSEPAHRLLNVHQAAERLAVSPSWLYRRARRIPFACRVGGHLRFDPVGLERWVATRSSGRG
jgi:hypothetical protein